VRNVAERKRCKRVSFAQNLTTEFTLPLLDISCTELLQLPEELREKLADELLEQHWRQHDPEYHYW
jgi:hypothetical protein